MDAPSKLLAENGLNGRRLKGIFGVVDGGRMLCADFIDSNIQNAYYTGYTCEVELTNLFVFKVHVKVIHKAINNPGSSYDSKISHLSNLMTKKFIDAMTPPWYAIIGGSEFKSRLDATDGKVVRTRERTESHHIPTGGALAAVDIVL